MTTADWMVGDRHECPLSSHEHRANAECVAYARMHGDHGFVDHCGWPVPAVAGGPPEQCAREALHDGECGP